MILKNEIFLKIWIISDRVLQVTGEENSFQCSHHLFWPVELFCVFQPVILESICRLYFGLLVDFMSYQYSGSLYFVNLYISIILSENMFKNIFLNRISIYLRGKKKGTQNTSLEVKGLMEQLVYTVYEVF